MDNVEKYTDKDMDSAHARPLNIILSGFTKQMWQVGFAQKPIDRRSSCRPLYKWRKSRPDAKIIRSTIL